MVQYLMSLCNLTNASPNRSESSFEPFNKCKTNLNAVRFPIPGKRLNSETVSSKILDEKVLNVLLIILRERHALSLAKLLTSGLIGKYY